jgi:hypothetical protein
VLPRHMDVSTVHFRTMHVYIHYSLAESHRLASAAYLSWR